MRGCMVHPHNSAPGAASCLQAVCPHQHNLCLDSQPLPAGTARAPDLAIPGSLAARPAANCLQGVRLGVFRPWNAHADAEVRRCLDSALAAAQDLGAQVGTSCSLDPGLVPHKVSAWLRMLQQQPGCTLRAGGPSLLHGQHQQSADLFLTAANRAAAASCAAGHAV